MKLTAEEMKVVRYAVKGSIDLYSKYIKLNPETTAMKRRQGVMAKRLVLLQSAIKKLA